MWYSSTLSLRTPCQLTSPLTSGFLPFRLAANRNGPNGRFWHLPDVVALSNVASRLLRQVPDFVDISSTRP